MNKGKGVALRNKDELSRMPHSGFTLIELSIVLVIISLIVGGIIGDKPLIRSAELNNVISDFKKYDTAINNFSLQYDYMPGDFPDAQAYWPSATVIDGDGNNVYNMIGSTPEQIIAWEHLNLAELVEGNYLGTYDSSQETPGIVVPEGPLIGSAWALEYDTTRFPASPLQVLFGGRWSGGYTTGPILLAKEAKQIDKKIDDGMPLTGNIIAANASGTPADCMSFGTEYIVSRTTLGCRLYFNLSAY